MTKAIEYLKEKEIGDFLIRPSSLSEDILTLSWKFYNNSIMHVNIKEENKMKGNTVGQTLLIGKEDYQNFEEIETRFIKPCARKVLETKNHPKFLEVNSINDLEEKLKEEQLNNPTYIPYKFTILPEFAGFIILGYMTPTKKFIK